MGLGFGVIAFVVTYKQKRKEYSDEVFEEKDLPVKEIIPFGTDKVYLYDLKKEKGVFVRDDLTYARIAKTVNRDIEIKLVGGEIVMDVPDYTDEVHQFKLIDIIALVTNFNYARFVFNGEDRFKLYTTESDFNNKLKSHALGIINEVVMDIVELIEEGMNNPSE
jgi:hypothetical protein